VYHPRTKTSHTWCITILVTLYTTSSGQRCSVKPVYIPNAFLSAALRRSIAVKSAPCIPSSKYAACNKTPLESAQQKLLFLQSLWDLQRTASLSETYNVQPVRLRPTTYSLSETYNVSLRPTTYSQSLWDLQRTASLRPTKYSISQTYRVNSLRDLQRTVSLSSTMYRESERPTKYRQSLWDLQRTASLRPTTYSQSVWDLQLTATYKISDVVSWRNALKYKQPHNMPLTERTFEPRKIQEKAVTNYIHGKFFTTEVNMNTWAKSHDISPDLCPLPLIF
jgi:hypothetical protein